MMEQFPGRDDVSPEQVPVRSKPSYAKPGGPSDRDWKLRRALVVRTVGSETLPAHGHWAALMMTAGVYAHVYGEPLPLPPVVPFTESNLELRSYYVLHQAICDACSVLSPECKNMLLASLKPAPIESEYITWQSFFAREWNDRRTYFACDRTAVLGPVSQLSTGQYARLWRQTMDVAETHRRELYELQQPLQAACRAIVFNLVNAPVIH